MDAKPAPRVREPALLRSLHLRGGECALADRTCEPTLSLHHVSKHPRDDVEANLVFLCGHGTAGHHGLVEAHDPDTRARLAAVLRRRPETMEYLRWRFPLEEPDAWIARHYG